MSGHAHRLDNEDDDERSETTVRAVAAVPAPRPAGTPAPPPEPGTPDADDPPDPAEVAAALARCVVEVLAGARDVDSIARWVSEDVHRHLLHRAAVAGRARALRRRARTRPLVQVGTTRVCPVAPGVVEAAVVVHTRSHARAVALRLEHRQGRWRAVVVGVL